MKYMQPNQPNPVDLRNLILTVVLCTGLLYLWQVTYLRPKQAEWNIQQAQKEAQQPTTTTSGDVVLPQQSADGTGAVAAPAETGKVLARQDALPLTPRVRIEAPALHGSINLKGLRFDDLTLVRHRTGDAPDSPEVVLLSPSQSHERYFAQIGWLPNKTSGAVTIPGTDSLWQADRDTLKPEQPVNLKWTSPEGVTFRVEVAVDANYMFTLTQSVENASGQTISVMPYGLLNRNHQQISRASIVHEGPVATINNELTEHNYHDMKESREQKYPGVKGWLGISDKYWLTAFIPDVDTSVDMHMQYMAPMGEERLQVDYLAPAQTVEAGKTVNSRLHFFAGAKELDLLQAYESEYHIPLFDRALDFGVLFFLTYPIFIILSACYAFVGNFGVAILILVLLLRIILYPLATKSYRSMAQMRKLAPELERIKKTYDHDKLRMQQETMALWKREQVNPVAGCLPMLIQLPVFFALYKVLMVTIEMRHAPFFLWITDLSAPDPTHFFNLFGAAPWAIPLWMPAFLHIGAWPIIMTITMVMQQSLSPKPTDPVQAKVITYMPYFFLFLFASFPAGLVIYWAWNNVLSMAQQWVITRQVERESGGKQKGEYIPVD